MCAHLPEVVNNQNVKTKVDQIQQFLSFYSDSSESEEEGQSEDDTGEPRAKQSKQDSSEGEKRENDSNSKLTKLDNLFSDKLEHGPKVHENLAKSLNRGISTDFSIKTALEFGENYKSPENCEFLRVLKLNEEMFFEESIAAQYKKK